MIYFGLFKNVFTEKIKKGCFLITEIGLLILYGCSFGFVLVGNEEK